MLSSRLSWRHAPIALALAGALYATPGFGGLLLVVYSFWGRRESTPCSFCTVLHAARMLHTCSRTTDTDSRCQRRRKPRKSMSESMGLLRDWDEGGIVYLHTHFMKKFVLKPLPKKKVSPSFFSSIPLPVTSYACVQLTPPPLHTCRHRCS